MLEKVRDWLEAGVRLIWVVDPARRTVRVHRQNDSVVLLRDGDVLDGEAVVPSFSCPVGSVF